MVWRPWSVITPADTDAVSAGAAEIRNVRDDIDDRFMTGDGAGGIVDLSGTRTVDTNPLELRQGVGDTTVLEAGAIGAIGRAVTYFGLTTIAQGGADVSHGAGTVAVLNQWENVTGAQLIIPGTVLKTTLGSDEHTNAANLGTSDYVIFIVATFLVGNLGNNANGDNDATIYRIYNTTNTATISQSDNAALGAAATHGVRSLRRAEINSTDTNYQWLTVFGRDTARTAATTYDLQFASVDGVTGTPNHVDSRALVKISLASLNMYGLVFKR